MASLVDRMVRAARLDPTLYEEVERDSEATSQAMAVVVLGSVAGGIGTGAGLRGIVLGTVAGLVGWYVWAALTYWIGTRWLPEPQTSASQGELLRTIGFATSPSVLRVLGVVGPLRGLVFLVTAVWGLVAVVIAVRQALDYRSTGRAVAVCLIGWVVQTVFFALVWAIIRG
jgi:hypothetical protein